MAYVIIEVDDEDADLLQEIRAVHLRTASYFKTLHRAVAYRIGYDMYDKDIKIDHIDGNPLNNKRDNLRQATQAQNRQNSGMMRHNTSGYKGVHTYKRGNSYRAQITANGVKEYLGTFVTAIEAARAYDKRAIELHGAFARTNFPREDYD